MPFVLCLLTARQETDTAGLPYSQARLWFTAPETNDPLTIFEDGEGDSEHSNPLLADGSGRFPPVYVTVGVSYRIRAFPGADLEDTPLWEVDPYVASATQTATIGTSGATVGLLNADKADSGDNTFSGDNAFTGSNIHSGSETYTGPVALPAVATVDGQRIGWRDLPIVTKNAGYTLVASDDGKGLRKTGATGFLIQIPPPAAGLPVGAGFWFRNFNAVGDLTIIRGVDVVLRIAGSATDAEAVIAPWGEGSVTQEESNIWVIRGTGITPA